MSEETLLPLRPTTDLSYEDKSVQYLDNLHSEFRNKTIFIQNYGHLTQNYVLHILKHLLG